MIAAVNAQPQIRLDAIVDDVLESHRYGAIETVSRSPLNTVMDLRMVYTPGVASVCSLIADRPDQAWKYTAKGRKIAIVTNGTAVLGLGDIGALAGLPVMEGKAAILARFVGVSAEPILIDSRDPDRIIAGNERVILPRLADAEFFYQTDLKTPLVQQREKLRQVVFQEKLGSIYDKTERVALLARTLAPHCGADPELAGQAAEREAQQLLEAHDASSSGSARRAMTSLA